MTGNDIKQLIKSRGMTMTMMAKELGTSPQNLNGKLNSGSVKMDFLNSILAVLDKCCPPLPAEVEVAVNGSGVIGSHSHNATQYVGADAALVAENQLLRQQNEYLQQLLNSAMAKIPKG